MFFDFLGFRCDLDCTFTCLCYLVSVLVMVVLINQVLAYAAPHSNTLLLVNLTIQRPPERDRTCRGWKGFAKRTQVRWHSGPGCVTLPNKFEYGITIPMRFRPQIAAIPKL